MKIVADTFYFDPKVAAILQKPKRVTTFLTEDGDSIPQKATKVTQRGKSSVVTIVSGVDKPNATMLQCMEKEVPSYGTLHAPFVTEDELSSYGMKAVSKLSAVRTKYVKKSSGSLDDLQQPQPEQKFYQHIHRYDDSCWQQLAL